jgi:hypothetical protein
MKPKYLGMMALCAGLALAPSAFAQGVSGTTLAASKTLEICVIQDSAPLQWRYTSRGHELRFFEELEPQG